MAEDGVSSGLRMVARVCQDLAGVVQRSVTDDEDLFGTVVR